MRPRQEGRAAGTESGFTLLEVVVALALLGVVSTAAFGLFVSGLRTGAALQRRQLAAEFAGRALETARGLSPLRDGAGNSPLVAGRSQTAVAAQWAAATRADASQTDQAYDTTAAGSSTPSLPLTSSASADGVSYLVSVLVGSCWRPTAGGDCVTAAAKASASVFMYRVIALVTWPEGAGTTCPAGTCDFSVSTLIDPASDPTFNPNATYAAVPAAPVLHAISTSVASGSATTVDTTTAVTSGATPLTVAVGSVTSGGSAVAVPSSALVRITATSGFHGTFTVTFTLSDPYAQSATTTATVTVP